MVTASNRLEPTLQESFLYTTMELLGWQAQREFLHTLLSTD